jgi:hypothetical protein
MSLSPAQCLEAIRRAFGGTVPPRRAVLKKGVICEKSSADDEEVDVISRTCDILRVAFEISVVPRESGELMGACIKTNDPAAWSAACDDIRLEKMDWDRAIAVACTVPDAAAVFVACLVNVQSHMHLVHAASVLTVFVPRTPPEMRTAFGKLLGLQLGPFLEAFARCSGSVRRDVREAILMGIGKVLDIADVPEASVADMFVDILRRRKDELLRLFLNVPLRGAHLLAHRPELLGMLLERARACPPAARYPLLGMTLKLSTGVPGALAGREAQVAELARESLAAALQSGSMDARVALVGSLLVQAAGADPLALALAGALEQAATALIRGIVPT